MSIINFALRFYRSLGQTFYLQMELPTDYTRNSFLLENGTRANEIK